MISERGNRNLRGESGLKFPAKSPRVSSDVALKDRDCIFPCKDNKVSYSPTEKKTYKGGKFLKKLWCCVGGSITR